MKASEFAERAATIFAAADAAVAPLKLPPGQNLNRNLAFLASVARPTGGVAHRATPARERDDGKVQLDGKDGDVPGQIMCSFSRHLAAILNEIPDPNEAVPVELIRTMRSFLSRFIRMTTDLSYGRGRGMPEVLRMQLIAKMRARIGCIRPGLESLLAEAESTAQQVEGDVAEE